MAHDVGQLVRSAAALLAAAGVESARTDAELLLAHAAGMSRSDVVTAALLGRPLDVAGAAEAFDVLVARRAEREPLQHLVGSAPFRHLELEVGPGVFVPRPETETVAQRAVDETVAVLARTGAARVVDLCTGSGAIALAVATEAPGCTVHAVELDAAALGWARRNVERILGDQGPEPRLIVVRGDARRALSELDGLCDVVVTNPPYVPPGAVPKDPEVALHDPGVALYGLGSDGLEVPRGVAAAAARLLRPGGLLVMEHAEVQAAAARAMIDDLRAFEPATTGADLTGRPRMVVARRTVGSRADGPTNMEDSRS
ncbi:peptide chain release factor N(5)-glutamine methyltransferase [Sanguibacter antarcticus]|uniref:Release factor glutamine methyltransferase n=1 Tax=Sanguibacter antarcticus TaxID=372484 RepID=A0A2A9E188_9MICO|nr:peptide chain release factor N(5)-glutamine methyltransferase [Sanguibacter antarcticus]PFG32613.1 release factor glutamine methyltransferase [Sanguibacter antarcticus]